MDFTTLLGKIDDVVWGVPMMILIMGTGLFLTIRLGVVQIRHLGIALKYMFKNEEGGSGEVSSFGALCTTLAATIGTGNIVGVATAIVLGGPGALFWMIIAAFFGMATKYAEGLLAIQYRVMDEEGHALGGPFMYIERGMGSSWKWLAKIFAIFGTLAGLLGIGTMTQVNGIASAVRGVADPENIHLVSLFGKEYSWAIVITALVVTLAVALVVIGGIQRIAAVTSIVVPFMAVLYILVCLIVIISNAGKIPGAISEVVASAFGLRAAAGGAVGAIMIAMQKGVARGIFSNEAGLGSAPIAVAAAQTNSSARQGLVTMTGVFLDTVVICVLTALTILVTDSYNIGLEGVDVTMNAFKTGVGWNPQIGGTILAICLAFFAYTTILGWDYYSERCLEYLSGGRKGVVKGFRWLYILAVLAGPFLSLDAVWTIADIFNGLMAIPNLIALLALSGVVVAETRVYFKMLKDNDGREDLEALRS